MQTIGEELKVARERRGLTYEDVYSITRIDPKLLAALEENRFDILPAPYIKAFLKSFASTVGANVAGIMRQYEEAYPSKEEEVQETVSVADETKFSIFVKDLFTKIGGWVRMRNRLVVAVAGAVSLIVILVIIFSLPGKEQVSESLIASEPTGTGPESGFNFTVSAVKHVYLMVSIDRGDSLDYNLLAESKREFHAEDSLWILASDISAVKLYLDDKPVGGLPATPRTAHFTVDSSGIKDLKTYALLSSHR